jgi:hypothetical protein
MEFYSTIKKNEIMQDKDKELPDWERRKTKLIKSYIWEILKNPQTQKSISANK